MPKVLISGAQRTAGRRSDWRIVGTSEDKRSGILLESGTNEVEFLRISLGSGHFGVNVGKVCQILVYDAEKVSVPPHGQPGFVGFVYFRGKPISVYDLSVLLDMRSPEASGSPRLLLVCEFNRRVFGYVIDQVHGIHRTSWDSFKPLQEVGTVKEESVVGTVTVGQDIVLILDLEAMMGRIDSTMGVEAFEAEVETPADSGGGRSDLKVLYCEDSPVVQKVLLKALRKGGFEKFEVFATGKAGLDWIKAHNPKDVDIIISDVEMPGMDGLTLCREVRSLEGWKDKPFIVFSSMVNEQMKSKCKSVGADAAFAKPEAHLIIDAIDSMLKRS